MRLDPRLVILAAAVAMLVVAGCTRQRVSNASEIPSVSIASSASAAVADVAATRSDALATQDAATVSLNPSHAKLRLNEKVVIEIQIQNVSELFGADIRLKYDPNVIEIIDTNTLVPGTQIASGAFPDISDGKGFVAQNTVDPQKGTIGYAMTLLSPAEPVSGSGTLASITVQGKAAGDSDITFTSVLLSDINAAQIPANRTDGTVTVTGEQAPPSPTPTASPIPTQVPTPRPPTKTPVTGQCVYTVEPGDTLFSIAQKFGITVSEIAQANALKNVNQIEADQTLVIPGCEPGTEPPPPPPAPSETCSTHVIQPGDTLFSLAQRYGVTVDAITVQNNIVNPSLIYIGQELTICPTDTPPPPGPEPTGDCTPYTVDLGDTLFSIALHFNVTVQELARANNISSTALIYEDQELCIPK